MSILKGDLRSYHFYSVTTHYLLCLALLCCTTRVALAQSPEPPAPLADSSEVGQPDGDASPEIDYLTRGPLHEAFADPYEPDPQPREVIVKQPPEPIEELPPKYKPDGKSVVWIPGYWAFEDERDDFIWISGVWRDLPPDRIWVPGYWDQVDNGHRYVTGFWAADKVADVEYLPLPPATLEQGPSAPAPGEDYFYVPGNWAYAQNDFQWTPGFWSRSQTNWVWTPSQYVWTPRGCVYQDGYWDYDMGRRGVVFSPIYYQQPIYRDPNYQYRPQFAISTGVGLFVNLFVNPRSGSYFFGDYYGSRYNNQFYPWATRYQNAQHYDPFYSNYRQRSQAGGGGNLASWITNQHQRFDKDDRLRPARTVRGQLDQMNTNRNANLDPTMLRLSSVAESLDDMVSDNDTGLEFQTIDDDAAEQIRKAAEPLRKMSRERVDFESTAATKSSGRELNSNARVEANAPDETDNTGEKKPDSRNNLNANANVSRGRLKLNTAGSAAANASRAAKANAAVNLTTQANPRAANPADGGNTARGNDTAGAGGTARTSDAARGTDAARGSDSMRPPRPNDWPIVRTDARDDGALPSRPNTTARGNASVTEPQLPQNRGEKPPGISRPDRPTQPGINPGAIAPQPGLNQPPKGNLPNGRGNRPLPSRPPTNVQTPRVPAEVPSVKPNTPPSRAKQSPAAGPSAPRGKPQKAAGDAAKKATGGGK